MSLANVLAPAQAARNLVLLGDPQQSSSRSRAVTPRAPNIGSRILLDGDDTIPAEKGLFLAETWRLHPDIAKFTSEVYYDGKVESRPGLERQAILVRPETSATLVVRLCVGSGSRHVPVSHTGNRARSAEEVSTIRVGRRSPAEKMQLPRQERCRASARGWGHPTVAPYNAQVSALIETLPALGSSDRHRQPLPRPGSARGDLLDDVVEPGGCTAWHGVPLQPVPLQRGDVDGQGALHPRWQSRSVQAGVPDT